MAYEQRKYPALHDNDSRAWAMEQILSQACVGQVPVSDRLHGGEEFQGK